MTDEVEVTTPGHVLRQHAGRRWFELEEPLGGAARIVFTTRAGGRSKPPYDSLNLGFHVGDVGERVRLNRLDVASSLPRGLRAPVVGEQVHGVAATGVGELHAGARWEMEEKALLATDALVTTTHGLPLVTLVADCLPIALVDPAKRVAAAVHAGWRGLAGDGINGILENTLALMREKWECDPADVRAWIGPAIGACCYEIGDEVAAHFPAHVRAVDGSQKLDLREAARDRLVNCGIAKEGVVDLPLCTSCGAELFFSHRRATRAGETTTGRQAMLVWLEHRRDG